MVDLIAATCGIEADIVERATAVVIPDIGPLPVARAEELVAMKVLSMTDRRPQDRMDVIGILLVAGDGLDLDAVAENLRRITDRGYHRDQIWPASSTTSSRPRAAREPVDHRGKYHDPWRVRRAVDAGSRRTYDRLGAAPCAPAPVALAPTRSG